MNNALKSMTIGAAIVAAVATVGMTGCESMGRIAKNYESDWGGGLNRELTVYDATGDVLYEQTGKFDIQEDNSGGYRVVYDDEDGMRHNIYLGSGTVIVNEVAE